MEQEIIQHILHLVDQKIILNNMINNANQVMSYHNKIESESDGVYLVGYHQQKQFEEQIEKQQKFIEDNISDLLKKLS